MKKSFILSLIFTLTLLLIVDNSYARGGKNRGNRSGGGKSSSNRSSSQKRSSSGNSSSQSRNFNKGQSRNSNRSSSGNKHSKHSESKHSGKDNKSNFKNNHNNKNHFKKDGKSNFNSKNQNRHNGDHKFNKNNYKGNYSKKSWNNNKHYDHHHDHWHHGHWNDHHHHPVAIGVGVWGAWNLGSRIYSSGYYSYSNPYYVESTSVEEVPAVNYSVPIDSSVSSNDPANGDSDVGMEQFDIAISEFKNGNYPEALNQSNSVLKSLPNDMAIHEFRALSLFAMGNYTESASAVYSLLSVGPGWDWKTMRSLYVDAATYTKQLRTLENFCRDNKEDTAARFLLAYHYITCGHIEYAVRELKVVSKLNPDDQLSKRLIGSFETEPQANQDEPPSPQAAAESTLGNAASTATTASSIAVSKETLAGTWIADQGDQGKITLTMNPDGNYIWEYKSNNVNESIKGTYIVGGKILTMIDSSGRPMVGNIIQSDQNQFNFKLTGNGPDDPGLNFKK